MAVPTSAEPRDRRSVPQAGALWSLGQLLIAAVLAGAVLGGLLLFVVFRGSEQAALASADAQRALDAQRVTTRVSRLLASANGSASNGFTTVAEALEPDALACALGAYLETMVAAIEGTQGTIDKFIGDAVMAFWNAPDPVAEHARRGCEAALRCQETTRALYASARWDRLPTLTTRFGLHVATVLVGHFGAPTRLSYTAIGDGVNVAARLEGLNKQYGTELMVSEAVVRAAGDGFRFRKLDKVAVKGRASGIWVYELVGRAPNDEQHEDARLPAAEPLEKTASAGRQPDRYAVYEQALKLYLSREFVRAIEQLSAQSDDDPPSAVLAARCERYAEAPPPEGWDGTYVSTKK